MTERTIDLIDTYCVNCEYAKNDMENEPCYSCIEGYNNNLIRIHKYSFYRYYIKKIKVQSKNVFRWSTTSPGFFIVFWFYRIWKHLKLQALIGIYNIIIRQFCRSIDYSAKNQYATYQKANTEHLKKFFHKTHHLRK